MPFYRLISKNYEQIEGACVALIGGGGKTALLHKIADELSQKFPSVLQTSITKTAFNKHDNPLIFSNVDQIKFVKRNPLFLIGEKIDDNKLKGITASELDQIRRFFNVTIFECDGARNKPLKAHTEYDPVVPKSATHVIIIIGADVVNTKISDGLVHRPELFCRKWNVALGTRLDIDFIVEIVSTKRGYHEKIKHDDEISYFVNKADEHPESAIELAKALYETTNKPVFYGSVKTNHSVRIINE